MPRFFFHVQDGPLYPDEEGLELPDQHRARAIALEILSHLVRSANDGLWCGGSFCVLAEDERRAPLFRLEVKAVSADAHVAAKETRNLGGDTTAPRFAH